MILINAKDDSPLGTSGAAIAKFDAAAFDALDAEVASVFADDDLITPDQVQGKHATLREAVLAGGWPKLRDARGRVFFALDEAPKKVAIYRGDRRSLEGRRMFVNIEESSPAAAYITLNEPLQDAKRIRAAVEAGFIVRTRADADTLEARDGKTERREAALALRRAVRLDGLHAARPALRELLGAPARRRHDGVQPGSRAEAVRRPRRQVDASRAIVLSI